MNKIKHGNEVKLPDKYTYSSHRFVVDKVFKNGDLRLKFLTGENTGDVIERFGQEEVIFINKSTPTLQTSLEFATKIERRLRQGVFPKAKDRINVIERALIEYAQFLRRG